MSQDRFRQMKFPCGQGGLNRSKNYTVFPPNDLSMVDGITIEDQTWRKEGGATKLNTISVGASTIRGLFDFWTGASPSVQKVVAVLANGQAVTVTPSGVGAALATGLGDGFPVFAEGWNGTTKALYFCNGQVQMQVYDGASWGAIPLPNTDWNGINGYPTGLFSHRESMVAYGLASAPHDVFMPLASNHGDYANVEAFRQEVGPGVGDGIIGGISWRETAYLFKRPFGIYVLDDSSPNIAEWTISALSKTLGIAGPGCWLEVDDDVLILGADGYFYSLSQVRNQGEKSTTPVLPLQMGDYLRTELNQSRLDLTQMIWYGHKRQVQIAVPALGSTVNTRRIVGDLTAGSLRILPSRRDTCSAIALHRSTRTSPPRPLIGDSAGFIWQLDQAARTKDGAGYRGQFEYAPRECYPGASRRGNLEFLDLAFAEKGNYDVTIEIHRDGKLSETKAFSQQSVGGAVGSFSLDSDVLGGTTIANRRHKVGGDALRVKLLGKNENAGEDFSIQDINLYVSPGREGAV